MSLKKGYAIFRNLSLDVVIGAVGSGAMVVWLLEIGMPWVWWIALPLAVWVIYTTDHLLDAYRLKDKAHTYRHLFHHHYFLPIAIIWGIGLLSCISWVPYFSPMPIIIFGFGMGGLVLVHLGLVVLIGNRVSWLFHKELGVGLIYAAGVWGGPVVIDWDGLDLPRLICFFQFFLMAMINLLFFSMYEARTDSKDGHTSFVLAIGNKRTKRLIVTLGVFCLIGTGYIVTALPTYRYLVVQGIFLLMLTVLLLIAFMPKWFGPKERYRAWGDGVFLFPFLIWLF